LLGVFYHIAANSCRFIYYLLRLDLFGSKKDAAYDQAQLIGQASGSGLVMCGFYCTMHAFLVGPVHVGQSAGRSSGPSSRVVPAGTLASFGAANVPARLRYRHLVCPLNRLPSEEGRRPPRAPHASRAMPSWTPLRASPLPGGGWLLNRVRAGATAFFVPYRSRSFHYTAASLGGFGLTCHCCKGDSKDWAAASPNSCRPARCALVKGALHKIFSLLWV